ncbi:MAG TPA: topoisomerase C-terminal repeat-containing protein, partial [Rugosibacter sp.]
EMDELLEKRVIGPLQGFRSKMGRAFAAMIKLKEDHTPEFDFGQSDADASEPVDFSGQESLGACPKCAARVFEHGMMYVCEKAVGAEKSCDFRSGKVILQQEIAREEMQKLLETGKTSLLRGFISNKTRRKFSAFLTRDAATGKVSFEFEPRVAKAGAKPAAKPGAKGTKSAAAKDSGDGSTRNLVAGSVEGSAEGSSKAAVAKPKAASKAKKAPAKRGTKAAG